MSESIPIDCPACQRTFESPLSELADKVRIACPHCGARIRVAVAVPDLEQEALDDRDWQSRS
jgi:DNA-directed RNA polymerase subunit RPC12/RpoP